MAGSTNPIFVSAAITTITAVVTGANTATDGTGTVSTVLTAGANGALVKEIRFKAQGTNSATVARIFLNNGSSNATATNNSLIGELSMSATTASNSVAIGPDFSYPFATPGLFMPSGYKLNVCYGTAGAGGIIATGIGGDL
tara:strand:- start:917 stop:1339 length:423 start_codon:yes stop_codon:yes gene_type:complete